MILNWSEPAARSSSPTSKQATMPRLDRYRGCLVGLAVGDALGTTLEFQAPGTFRPLKDMLGGGPFRLLPGQWTDDTSMALCLAASLIERQGFDARDQMERYLRWRNEGYFSSTGRCFDIGRTVATALRVFETTGNPWAGSAEPNTAGNGSLMRLAPVAMYYALQPAEAIERAAESSRTTHGTATAIDSCRFYAALLVGALNGAPKNRLLAPRYCPAPDYWDHHPLHPAIVNVADGSYKSRRPPTIRGTGYVVDSLEAALWAFFHSTTFSDGCLLAVNLGDDADTTGAIYGQLAGAYYGLEAIPASWRGRVALGSTIEALATQLCEQAEGLASAQDPAGPSNPFTRQPAPDLFPPDASHRDHH
jgi:ADP-ribosylglycohydrolase